MATVGRNIIVYLGNTAIASCKTADLDCSAELLKVASASDGDWEHYKKGRKSWSVSCGYLVVFDNFFNCLEVGATVTLRISLRDQTNNLSGAYSFAGIYAGTVSDTYITNPTGIYYHPTLKQFVARLGDVYYKLWAYSGSAAETYFTNPTTGDAYIDRPSGRACVWQTDRLAPFEMVGSAIIKQCKMSAPVAGLSSGTIAFQGNGPLLQPNL